MSEQISDFIENKSDLSDSISEKQLAEATKLLVNEFVNAKHFSRKQIKAMSILMSTSDTMKVIIQEWILNMKHLKGKFGNSCQKLIKCAFEGLGNIVQTEKQGFLNNIFNRER